MMRSKPFYWVDCDHIEGCDERCPPEDFEVLAWSDVESAELCAQDSQWRRCTKRPGPDWWFCPDHADRYCRRCEVHVGPLSGEQDYLCDRCLGDTLSPRDQQDLT